MMSNHCASLSSLPQRTIHTNLSPTRYLHAGHMQLLHQVSISGFPFFFLLFIKLKEWPSLYAWEIYSTSILRVYFADGQLQYPSLPCYWRYSLFLVFSLLFKLIADC